MINFGMQGPNIVNGNVDDADIAILFGDLSGNVEPVQRIDVDCLDWAEVAVLCGFFPSKGQARKNGWKGPVPRGFGQRKFGKQGRGVWYFNPIGFEEQLAINVDARWNKMYDASMIEFLLNLPEEEQ